MSTSQKRRAPFGYRCSSGATLHHVFFPVAFIHAGWHTPLDTGWPALLVPFHVFEKPPSRGVCISSTSVRTSCSTKF